MVLVGIGGAQGADDYSLIDSRLVESNISNLSVYVNSSTVKLQRDTQTLHEIPIRGIIGRDVSVRLTKSEMMKNLSEGAILIVTYTSNNHYGACFRFPRSSNTSIEWRVNEFPDGRMEFNPGAKMLGELLGKICNIM